MRIYWIKAQAPRRVLALAKHLNVAADYVEMAGNLKTPDYAALNPNLKAPTVVDRTARSALAACESPRTSQVREDTRRAPGWPRACRVWQTDHRRLSTCFDGR